MKVFKVVAQKKVLHLFLLLLYFDDGWTNFLWKTNLDNINHAKNTLLNEVFINQYSKKTVKSHELFSQKFPL